MNLLDVDYDVFTSYLGKFSKQMSSGDDYNKVFKSGDLRYAHKVQKPIFTRALALSLSIERVMISGALRGIAPSPSLYCYGVGAMLLKEPS